MDSNQLRGSLSSGFSFPAQHSHQKGSQRGKVEINVQLLNEALKPTASFAQASNVILPTQKTSVSQRQAALQAQLAKEQPRAMSGLSEYINL